jgi:hypothetical protein
VIVVVEIASRRGAQARKEYDAPSVNAALRAAEQELRNYPTFQVVDAWAKDDHATQFESLDATHIATQVFLPMGSKQSD